MEIKKFEKQNCNIEIVKNDNDPISLAIKSSLPIRQIEESKQKTILLSEVAALAMRFNSDPSSEMIALMTNDLCYVLRNEYSHLSFEEVKLAFARGLSEKYGENFGMSLNTFLRWLYRYNKERQRHLSDLLLQKDIERINKEDKIWKQKQGQEIINNNIFGYSDIEVKDRNEIYKDTILKYKRFTYKKRYVDILKYKNTILARKMNSIEWLKVENEEKVLKYLVGENRQ